MDVNLLDNANEERFIVAPDYLTDREILIILSDIAYWNNNYDDLEQWCLEYQSQRQGMTVVCPDKQTLTAFCLRWS